MKKTKKMLIVLGIFIMLNLTVFIPNNLLNNYDFQDKPTPIHSNGNQILLHTPENITYTSPMSGYYPATFGFEDVPDDSLPSYCYYDAWGTSPDWTNSYTKVIDEKTDSAGNKHNKVLVLNDLSTSSACGSNLNFTEYGSEIARDSTIEFYFCIRTTGSIHYVSRLSLSGNYGPLFTLNFDSWSSLNDPEILFVNSSGQYSTGFYQEWEKWYRYSVDLSCDGGYAGLGANQFRFRIYNDTGTMIYTSYAMDFQIDHLTGGPNRFTMISTESQTQLYEYLDAFSITGLEDSYEIGDNLEEGLLLGYENNTSFDWQGYSLDGQPNKTILGNTTIPFPDIGLHTIQVFANDSLGLNYCSDIRYFTVRSVIHIITPENKTYTEPMSGYYPATFGFEETITGTLPSYCDYAPGGSSPDGPGSYAKVIDGWTDGAGNTHKKVLKMYDRTSSGTTHASLDFTEDGSEIFRNSTIEFWACNTLTGNYYHSYFEIWGDLGNMVSFEWDSGGTTNDPEVRITPATGEFGTGVYHEWNRWYRYSIDISCDGGYAGLGANQFRFRIYNETGDLIYSSADLDLLTAHPTGGPYRYHVLSTETQSDVSHYLDGFGVTGLQDNYITGDNIEEGLLLSFENSTALDWMGYSLDGQEIKTILGNTTFSFPEDGKHSIRVFGNDSLGTEYQSATRHFSTHHISVVTPENKTYIGPMSGYYPATYGFENDEDGTFPNEWVESGQGAYQGKTNVINAKDGHNKVIHMDDDGTTVRTTAGQIFNEEQSSGTIELWTYFTSYPSSSTDIRIENSSGNLLTVIGAWENTWKYRNGTTEITVPLSSINEWFHIRIDFCCVGNYNGLTSQTYNFTIRRSNGSIYYESPTAYFLNYGLGNAARLSITSWQLVVRETWIDAVGYSWDPNYNIGDNLKEGLLLSYENSTALDWQGYSLDGQPVATIFGNTTIRLPEDGSHMIKVFGNDTFGVNYESNIRQFSVHHISIVTPEDKVYTGPMSGYYPAIHGFECDENDNFPKGWTDNSGANGYAKVIDGIGGHNKVLECYSSSSDDSRVDSSIFFDSQEHGSIEFWWYKSSSYTSAAIVDFWGETPGACISIRVDHWPSADNNQVQYQTGAGYLDTGYPYYADNKWMHFRIDFNCISDTYSLWIDQVKYLDNIDFLNSKDETGVNQTRFDSYNAANAVLYYVDAVSFSWDIDYSVGANLNEGLLLSFKNSTELEWIGYSLDSQSNKTILGNTTIPMPEDGIHSIQVFGNDSLGDRYQSDLRYFTVDFPIDIITPEAKTYIKGMSGYYPGTYGFENDKYGEQAQDWWTENEVNCDSQIIPYYKGHNDVYELSDNNPSDKADILNTFENRTYGTIEAWFLHRATSYWSGISIDYRYPFVSMISLDFVPGSYLTVSNGSTQITVPELGTMQADTWYHIRFDFRIAGAPPYMGLSDDSFMMYLNGKKMNEELLLKNIGSPINTINFRTGWSAAGPDNLFYVDAVGYSWDPYYTIGDNMNEGLLLSYENNTNLDWQGYSLDGQANVTIYGNTTIPLPDVCQHTIQVFANDSLGLNYYSNIRYFTVNTTQYPDLIAPVITINLPGLNTLFGNDAPSYDLTIIETDLNSIWYTLDGGTVNTTITEPTGTISLSIWSNRPNGTVDIRFYADDLAGNVGFEDVKVRKDTIAPQITIISPIENQVFYDTAPSFDLTIIEGNLGGIWYTLDDGIINFTCDLSGNFNNLYWNAIPPGDYTLKFYATDILGNLGSSEVSIEKKEPIIPGYNPLLVSLIIVIGIMGISLKLKKKSK